MEDANQYTLIIIISFFVIAELIIWLAEYSYFRKHSHAIKQSTIQKDQEDWNTFRTTPLVKKQESVTSLKEETIKKKLTLQVIKMKTKKQKQIEQEKKRLPDMAFFTQEELKQYERKRDNSKV